MTKRALTLINPANVGWDAPINDNFSLLKDFPIPVAAFANVGALPPAAENAESIAFVTVSGRLQLAVSNGSSWSLIGLQAASQADSTATTVVDLRTDLNALLAKLRAAGLIAP